MCFSRFPFYSMKASFETNFKMLLPLPAHVIFQIVHIYLYPSHTGLSVRKNETYEQIYDALIQNISRYSLHVVLVILLTIIKEKSLKNEKNDLLTMDYHSFHEGFC